MKTSRRGLFSLFAAAVVAPVAAKAAISAEPLKPSGPCKACAARLGRPVGASSATPGHTHTITAPAHSHGHWWDGVENLNHKHSFSHPDGRVWVL
jgi:hypothetical protein